MKLKTVMLMVVGTVLSAALVSGCGSREPEKPYERGMRSERRERFKEKGRAGKRRHAGYWSKKNLTEEQLSQKRDEIKGLKKEGAEREDIKERINELYEEWGIEKPEKEEREKK